MCVYMRMYVCCVSVSCTDICTYLYTSHHNQSSTVVILVLLQMESSVVLLRPLDLKCSMIVTRVTSGKAVREDSVNKMAAGLDSYPDV